MLGDKHAFSECYVCEVMHAMSTSTVHPLNTIRGVFGQQFDPLVFEKLSKFTTKRAKMTVKE